MGLGSKRFSRRAMTSTSVSLAWSLPDSTNLSPVEVMAGRSFSPAQVRERASARRGPLRVTAPVGAARTGSARKSIAEGQATSARGARGSAASEPQVCPSTYPPFLDLFRSSCHGRLGVPRATRATRWPPPRRRRPARPAAAPSPGPSSPGPEAPKQCKHPSLPCLEERSTGCHRHHRRRTKTPLKRLEIQFGFGAWKINVLVDHIPP